MVGLATTTISPAASSTQITHLQDLFRTHSTPQRKFFIFCSLAAASATAYWIYRHHCRQKFKKENKKSKNSEVFTDNTIPTISSASENLLKPSTAMTTDQESQSCQDGVQNITTSVQQMQVSRNAEDSNFRKSTNSKDTGTTPIVEVREIRSAKSNLANKANSIETSQTIVNSRQPSTNGSNKQMPQMAANNRSSNPLVTVVGENGEKESHVVGRTETGYKSAQSPTNSEGSADSGRATGRPTSCSPFDVAADLDVPPVYEFEIPNTLVGLIIGIKGKTIKELCQRTQVKMLIRGHFTPAKFNTHQICSVEGRREDINRCLQLIRHRFPQDRFPDLNLKPVLPLPLPPVGPVVLPGIDANGAATTTPSNGSRQPPIPLSLPADTPCEVYVSAPVDAGHFFCQLPQHPTFQWLQILDSYMMQLYGNQTTIPELPKPCNVGVLCAAPAYNGWFRAITLLYDEEQDETLVRFVDYGGFAKLPRTDLRQIRTDFMNLPLQAIECYLAHVQPIDGTSHWSEQANELFQKHCMAKICQAKVVGYNRSDNIPVVELYVLGEKKKVLRMDTVLLEKELAKPADPSRTVDVLTFGKNNKDTKEKADGHPHPPLLLTPPDGEQNTNRQRS
jgi:A-kinase anchor protein 1